MKAYQGLKIQVKMLDIDDVLTASIDGAGFKWDDTTGIGSVFEGGIEE